MRINKLKLRRIYSVVEKFFKSHPVGSARGRGRPKKYSDALIVALVIYQEAHGLSVREVLEEAEEVFGQVPVPSNYLYRRAHVNADVLDALMKYLTVEAAKKVGAEPEVMFIDGTGFSYDDLYPMKYERGTSIRRIKAHVRGVVVVADFGKVGSRHLKGIVGIKVGGPYASEVGLAQQIYDDWARGRPPCSVLVGDALYAVVRQAVQLDGLGVEPHFRVRQDTFRSKIRNQVLLAMRERVEQGHYYKRRAEIESVFSEIKQKMTSVCRTRSQRAAQIMMLARFAAWNIYMLIYAQQLPHNRTIFFLLLVCLP